ncbi:MAG TPA: hypothetical protein VNI01_12565 [Elusimicrobiota bacterium]|nr:hypothetical protein [Elusimicrobiota bacterium]
MVPAGCCLIAPCADATGAAPAHDVAHRSEAPTIDPHAAAIVTVQKADEWESGGVTILTQAVAVKETGPKETVARFGEVYSFSPTFFAVRREQRVLLRVWNLQPDDEHDFALMGPKGQVLYYTKLPPLGETLLWVTFHAEGPIDFKCLIHLPNMAGQILVLRP